MIGACPGEGEIIDCNDSLNSLGFGCPAVSEQVNKCSQARQAQFINKLLQHHKVIEENAQTGS